MPSTLPIRSSRMATSTIFACKESGSCLRTRQVRGQRPPSVPKEIYTIPPSSPVYNVTYVTQSTDSEGTIQPSYTAGYLGTFIAGAALGAILANGTGYYYPPYYGYPVGGYPIYHPYPCTYGVGSYYNPYYGRLRSCARGLRSLSRGRRRCCLQSLHRDLRPRCYSLRSLWKPERGAGI